MCKYDDKRMYEHIYERNDKEYAKQKTMKEKKEWGEEYESRCGSLWYIIQSVIETEPLHC